MADDRKEATDSEPNTENDAKSAGDKAQEDAARQEAEYPEDESNEG